MAGFVQLLLALVTPWGRLPQLVYGVLTLAVGFAHGAIFAFLANHAEAYTGYNPLSMLLIVLIWVQFCLTSRRFHDSNSAAFFLLPLMILTIGVYLYAIDHAHLADSPFQEDRDDAALADQVRTVFQTIGLMIMLFALKSSGDSGDNAFGPEFDLRPDTLKGRRRTPSRQIAEAQAKPVSRAPTPVPKPAAPQSQPLDRVGLPKERRQNMIRSKPGEFGRR
jgi:uncharacterized membrane protein YhaH (DUF805 family)